MTSHQDRVRQNYCEHEVKIGLIYWDGKRFVADCEKCGKRLAVAEKNGTVVIDE